MDIISLIFFIVLILISYWCWVEWKNHKDMIPPIIKDEPKDWRDKYIK